MAPLYRKLFLLLEKEVKEERSRAKLQKGLCWQCELKLSIHADTVSHVVNFKQPDSWEQLNYVVESAI